jgi:hypothetical protein
MKRKSGRWWLSIDVWRNTTKLKGRERESGNNVYRWHQPRMILYTFLILASTPSYDSNDDHVWVSCWQDSMCVCMCGMRREWKSRSDRSRDGIRTYATRRQATMMRRWSRQWSRQVTVMISCRIRWWLWLLWYILRFEEASTASDVERKISSDWRKEGDLTYRLVSYIVDPFPMQTNNPSRSAPQILAMSWRGARRVRDAR